MSLSTDVPAPPPNPAERPLDRDLGFGSLAMRRHYRLVNRDGSFNVRRLHEGWSDQLFGYHAMVNLSWPKFFVVTGAWYTATNALFAFGYLALGPGALQGGYKVRCSGARFSSASIPSQRWVTATSFPSAFWRMHW